MEHSSGAPHFSTLRGRLFERYGHDIIAGGGKFDVRELFGAQKYEVTLLPLEQYLFIDDQVIKERYCIPNSDTFQGVDAIVLPSTVYQFTVGEKKGQRKFLTTLKNIIKCSNMDFIM